MLIHDHCCIRQYAAIEARNALIGVIYLLWTETLIICVSPIMFITSCNENNYFNEHGTLVEPEMNNISCDYISSKMLRIFAFATYFHVKISPLFVCSFLMSLRLINYAHVHGILLFKHCKYILSFTKHQYQVAWFQSPIIFFFSAWIWNLWRRWPIFQQIGASLLF